MACRASGASATVTKPMRRPATPAMPEALSGLGDHMAGFDAEHRLTVLKRAMLVAMIAFLTLIDLFGSQALLPTLVEFYGVSPAAMGVAVNAATVGMAAASLGVAFFADRIDRKRGIWLSLAILSIPTALLAFTDDLTSFALLRVVQGVCMSTAFTLTLTYLSEECSVTAAAGAMAAFITGNVASNLVGRLLAAEVAGTFGLAESFLFFAALNLTGAALALWYIGRTSARRPVAEGRRGGAPAVWRTHLSNPALRPAFAIGFILLFAFVATFTYANFVLAQPPFALPQAQIGLVYFVFAPAILTTPAAAAVVARYGVRRAFAGSMLISLAGLALLVTASLPLFLLGLAAVGAGLFFAQSVAAAHVGRSAGHDHAAANGLYLTCYYVGGLAGAFVLGQVYAAAGWVVAVALMMALLALAAVLGQRMTAPVPPSTAPAR